MSDASKPTSGSEKDFAFPVLTSNQLEQWSLSHVASSRSAPTRAGVTESSCYRPKLPSNQASPLSLTASLKALSFASDSSLPTGHTRSFLSRLKKNVWQLDFLRSLAAKCTPCFHEAYMVLTNVHFARFDPFGPELTCL